MRVDDDVSGVGVVAIDDLDGSGARLRERFATQGRRKWWASPSQSSVSTRVLGWLL